MEVSPNNKEILRESKNQDEMVAKLQKRDDEARRRAAERGGASPQRASEELNQLRGRRHFTPLSPDQRKLQEEPLDSEVLRLRNAVAELSNRIDTAISQNLDARNALLKGRVTVGNPERTAHSSND